MFRSQQGGEDGTGAAAGSRSLTPYLNFCSAMGMLLLRKVVAMSRLIDGSIDFSIDLLAASVTACLVRPQLSSCWEY